METGKKDTNKKGSFSKGYDDIASNVFLPIFPIIAKDALSFTHKTSGNCLDIGCGGGHFGYFIELLSDFNVTFLDSSPDAIESAKQRGIEWGLDDRSQYIVSDVHDMSSIPDNCFDLIVSRGSIPFWGTDDELVQAFREIYRILLPNGTAIIGGSLGFPRLQDAITKKMREKDPTWQPPSDNHGDCLSGYNSRSELLKKAGINNHPIVNDKGHWIIIYKK